MTIYYVDDTATGANTGLNPTDAWPVGFSMVGVVGAGDIVRVAHTHDETDENIRNWDINATPGDPCFIVSVDFGASFAYRAGAFIGSKSATNTADWTFNFTSVVFVGVDFITPDGISIPSAQTDVAFYDATFGTTRNSTSSIFPGADPCFLHLFNVALTFGYAGGHFNFDNSDAMNVEWRGGSVVNAMTTLCILNATSRGASFTGEGLDLSNVTNLVSLPTIDADVGMHGIFSFTGCLLKSGYALNGGAGRGNRNSRIELRGCDESADLAAAAYKYEHFQRAGESLSVDTHFRDDGASDGSTNFSQRLTAAANETIKGISCAAVWFDVAVYISTEDASVTVEVEFAHNGVGSGTGGDLQNDEIWMDRISPTEVATETAQMTVVDGQIAFGATPSDVASSSKAWTDDNTPDIPNKQKLSVTFTNTIKGKAVFRVYLATGSASDVDVYVCPKPEVS